MFPSAVQVDNRFIALKFLWLVYVRSTSSQLYFTTAFDVNGCEISKRTVGDICLKQFLSNDIIRVERD